MSPEEQDRLLKVRQAATSAQSSQRSAHSPRRLQEFFQEVREVDRDNEVNRILGAFKLNPMEQLGLRFDASLDDVKRQYRKTSLLVHPDKCKHPRAQDAFEVLGHAHKQMQDEGKLKELVYVLGLARGALVLVLHSGTHPFTCCVVCLLGRGHPSDFCRPL